MAVVLNEDTQFLSVGGKPLVGGRIYIGNVDQDPVANPKTIYSDRELQTVLANPQVIDETGRATNKIWLSGRYSIQVNDVNGVQVFQDLDRGESESTIGRVALGNVIGNDTITAEATPTISQYVDKMVYVFTPVQGNSGPVTLNINSVGARRVLKNNFSLLDENDLVDGKPVEVMYNADGDEFLLTQRIPPIMGHISGLRMDQGFNAITIRVQPGEAASEESSGQASMKLNTQISKTVNLLWAAGDGNGGLDQGTLQASTWYYAHLIMRTDTGVVDVLLSASSSNPQLPTNYNRFRRIGAFFISGASEVTPFVQNGNRFTWRTPEINFSQANPGTAQFSTVVSVPPLLSGGEITWVGVASMTDTSIAGNTFCRLSSIGTTDFAPTTPNSQLVIVGSGGGQGAASTQLTLPSTGTILSRLSASDAGIALNITTLGWIDTRGSGD